MKTESGYAPSGEAELYYEIAGNGPPLVFIHAGVADSRQWNSEFAHYAQSHRVLRYDLRGYGRSGPVEGEFSHMGDLLTLLDELNFRQSLIMIGCSMGGGLAMDFALTHPDRVKALVMVGSGPSGLNLDVPGHPKETEAEEAYDGGDLERVAELEAQIWFDGMGRTAQQVSQGMRGLALEMNRLALTHAALQLGKRLPDSDVSAADRLDGLGIPVLILVGVHDIPFIQSAAEYMVEKIPSARKVMLEDAAH